MRTLNLAHRGFSGKFPENTMIAFEEAFLSGADGVELDVQMTRDGEVVIFHDEALDRMTNGTGYVAEMTLEEVRSWSVDGVLQEGLPDQRIPTLSEYLEWAHDKIFLTNIELKTKTSEDIGLEKKVLDLISLYGVENRTIISSFHRNNMARVKQLSEGVQTGLLVPGCNEHIIQLTKELGMDYIHPHALCIDEDMLETAQRYELGVNTWTVNERADLIKASHPKIHAIITDYPNRLKAIQEKQLEVV